MELEVLNEEDEFAYLVPTRKFSSGLRVLDLQQVLILKKFILSFSGPKKSSKSSGFRSESSVKMNFPSKM
ncbi:hypothetical protein PanWU01x14_135270 [Parasponia andersonii]|uniref:Uncharacterized protein n=1 Tax=Parasponia andersonii TaxID=3476 RepID=A0A2P5CPA2_PARAD|nr:hypothetical protein PanWU01x14_135270 [Parasponia andersonii]